MNSISKLSANEFLFTSESVTEGHPTRSPTRSRTRVLDAIMAEDPRGRVACETFVTTGMIVVGGEITTNTYVDIPKLARERSTRSATRAPSTASTARPARC